MSSTKKSRKHYDLEYKRRIVQEYLQGEIKSARWRSAKDWSGARFTNGRFSSPSGPATRGSKISPIPRASLSIRPARSESSKRNLRPHRRNSRS